MRLVALPSVYHLDIDLPYLMDVDNVGAQFNKDTRVCRCRIGTSSTSAAVTTECCVPPPPTGPQHYTASNRQSTFIAPIPDYMLYALCMCVLCFVWCGVWCIVL